MGYELSFGTLLANLVAIVAKFFMCERKVSNQSTKIFYV